MLPTWFDEAEPFRRPYGVSDADLLTDTAIDVLRSNGVDRLSVRAIARSLGVTPQAVLKNFPRWRVIELICIAYGDRWVVWASSPGTSPAR